MSGNINGKSDREERPQYWAAFDALESAHKACYEHPGRPILGMSHGPFSGVNTALGIVANMEEENTRLKLFIARSMQSSGEGKA